MLWASTFTVLGEHDKTPYMPLGINSMAGTDVCHTRRRRRNLPHASDINSVMGAYNHLVPDDVKALVWFWLIDETLSANLVYQGDHEICSTTPSDEAMVKIMMMVW